MQTDASVINFGTPRVSFSSWTRNLTRSDPPRWLLVSRVSPQPATIRSSIDFLIFTRTYTWWLTYICPTRQELRDALGEKIGQLTSTSAAVVGTDEWLLIELQRLVESVNQHFERFDLNKAVAATKYFLHQQLCDIYLVHYPLSCFIVLNSY